MDDSKLLRYSRHILLDEIGIEGQERISGAHVLVVGAGGLGAPALMYLAAAGCGCITVADADRVDLTNLQRQIIYATACVGELKVDSAAQSMRALNPEVQIVTVPTRLKGRELETHVLAADVVLDCTDNFSTRQQINAACVQYKKPLVSGAAIRWDAQVSVFDLRDDASPCYACIYPPDEEPQEVACATLGVFAPLTGIVGAVQAAEALKLITGVGELLTGRLLMLDALHMAWTTLRVKKRAMCPICGFREDKRSM